MKIIKTSKVHQGRIHIPKEIKEILKFNDGETLIWKYDILNNLVILSKQDEIKSRFQTG